MNIRITRLTMTNFKCFREKELNLDEDIVTIRGRNGVGKTTIGDAILFCLFGKNTEGQSDLELFKTKKEGKVVHNLDCSVEMTLSITANGLSSEEGSTKTIKRSIKEVWVKKRGSEESVFKNNTVEYYVNGESQTKSDFDKYIASLIDERVFRAITNPNYFPSLKWQDQRNFLTAMVGSIEPEYIADTDELKALVNYFDTTDESLEEYLKHLSYQIKELKKKLEKIPIRLEEQNKALPELLDWDALEMELKKAQSELNEVEDKIAAIQKGDGADVKRSELRNQISATTMAIDKLGIAARTVSMEEENAKNKAVQEASLRFNEALNNQKLMEQTIEADKRMIERCKETDYEKELEILRSEWPTDKFVIDESRAFCPTCGQPLPQDQWHEKVEQMQAEFNERKEAKKRELNERAAKIKEQAKQAEEELKGLEDKLAEDTKSLETIKESINTIFSEKAKLEKQPVKTKEEILANDVQYVALSKQLSELKAALNSVTDSEDNTNELRDLQNMKITFEAGINDLLRQLATRQQYDKIQYLIDGINEEQKDLVKQLSELEKKEDVARQYQFKQNQLLEERINQHFKLVQWKLFRTVNNGGDSFEEPFCECYVNGVGYHSGLNQAARLNAGLDIINALCDFYRVSAPITIDNAEANLNILQTAGQQIRLQVFDSDLNLL